MKDYNEMAKSVFARRDQYIAERKRITQKIKKGIAFAVCFCLIAAAFVAPSIQKSLAGPGGQLNVNPNIGADIPNNYEDTSPEDRENVLLVNAAKGVMSADMAVQFTHYPDPPEQKVLKQFETAIGIRYSDFTEKIPDIFAKASFYSVDTPNATGGEYVAHDYVFGYRTSSGGIVEITVCSKEEPLRDCFVMCDNPKQSKINGKSVVILGYHNCFLVRFSWKNVNYDIEAWNITLEELESLLVGVIS